MALVGVVVGSQSDMPIMQHTLDLLSQLGIDFEHQILSAHRQPEAVRSYAASARSKGIEVIIAAAGGAAHLPGAMAAWSTLPVIGVPLPTSDLSGLDALLSIVQMPAGVPVATVSIGTAGAKNAAYLAAQILAPRHPEIQAKYEEFRRAQAQTS